MQMEQDIREQIEEINSEVKMGEVVPKSRKVSEMQVSQDEEGVAVESSKEMEKLRNKMKSFELQIQKINIDLGSQMKELRRGTALTHSQNAALL